MKQHKGRKPRQKIKINWLQSQSMFKILRKISLLETATFEQIQKETPKLARTTISDNLGILNAKGVLKIAQNSKDKRKRNYSINWKGIEKEYLKFYKNFSEFYFNETRVNKQIKTVVPIFIDLESLIKGNLEGNKLLFNLKTVEQIFLVEAIIESFYPLFAKIKGANSK